MKDSRIFNNIFSNQNFWSIPATRFSEHAGTSQRSTGMTTQENLTLMSSQSGTKGYASPVARRRMHPLALQQQYQQSHHCLKDVADGMSPSGNDVTAGLVSVGGGPNLSTCNRQSLSI